MNCKARWVMEEDGTESLEFDPPLETVDLWPLGYKAIKLPRLSQGFLEDEWFPVELIVETKG